MIGIKTLTMVIGLFMIMAMMITATDALDRRTSRKRTTPFAVRRGMVEDAAKCNLSCSDNGACQDKCNGSGVQKILLSVCYEGLCYCGFSP